MDLHRTRFGPDGILAEAARTGRYAAPEIEALAFEGERPDPAVLGRRWHEALRLGREIVRGLPAEHVGTCVLDQRGHLFRGSPDELRRATQTAGLQFRAGSIGGALPTVSRPS